MYYSRPEVQLVTAVPGVHVADPAPGLMLPRVLCAAFNAPITYYGRTIDIFCRAPTKFLAPKGLGSRYDTERRSIALFLVFPDEVGRDRGGLTLGTRY